MIKFIRKKHKILTVNELKGRQEATVQCDDVVKRLSVVYSGNEPMSVILENIDKVIKDGVKAYAM